MAHHYKGEIFNPEHGPKNSGAFFEMISLVLENINLNICENEEEQKALMTAIDISLSKIKPPSDTQRMAFSSFNIDCLIGAGSFGKIWKAKGKYNMGDVALKQQATAVFDLSNLWKERDIMIHLKHPRICQLIGAFVHKDVFFVMQLCHGSVAFLRTRINQLNAARFSVQLLEAIAWCHKKNIIHTDIKPDNVLINTANNAVLCDFGSAFPVTDINSSIIVNIPHGSPGFMDYEANKFLNFSAKCDIFAAACVIFEMTTKASLLMYNIEDQNREMYVQAFEQGRVVGLRQGTPVETIKTMERETLADRAKFAKDYAPLIRKMIIDRQHRYSAEQALQDESLDRIFDSLNLDYDNIDSSSDFVTREFNKDHSVSFELDTTDDLPAAVKLSLCTFHYDSNDCGIKRKLPEPIQIKQKPICAKQTRPNQHYSHSSEDE